MYISIICPTYNSSDFISKTIESILDQTYSKFEIIFSDDGSRDDTINILERFKIRFQEKKNFSKNN